MMRIFLAAVAASQCLFAGYAHAQSARSVYATLSAPEPADLPPGENVGEEVTLQKRGPFTVFARCILTIPQGITRIKIMVASTEADWFLTAFQPQPFTAGEAEACSVDNINIGSTGLLDFTYRPCTNGTLPNDFGPPAAASPSGTFIGLNLWLGTGMFGKDCFVAGQIITARGKP